MPEKHNGGLVSKVVGSKRRWRAYKARVRELPENYRTAVTAVERYLMHFVPANSGSTEAMVEDLADLFEQSAAAGRSIREIVGEDPLEFVEAFVQNYSKGGYVTDKDRRRLVDAVARAEEQSPR